MHQHEPHAIIVGASSGIGEALAREFHRMGWRIGLLSRRTEKLQHIAADLKDRVSVAYLDVAADGCVDRFQAMVAAMGGVDLVIISAGSGSLNPGHETALDLETVAVNVTGFSAIATSAFRQFVAQGHGHLAAISSVAALRGTAGAGAYCASKAFQSVYLDGLRASARKRKLPIIVTELQPGFVDTAMMKTTAPLPPLLRRILVSDADSAAQQMFRAILRRKSHAYIPRRYALIAFFLRLLPRPG